MKKTIKNTYQEKISKQNQISFLKGREYERLYQLSLDKYHTSRIVMKWFSGLSLEKNQMIADDVSKLLSLLSFVTSKSNINK